VSNSIFYLALYPLHRSITRTLVYGPYHESAHSGESSLAPVTQHSLTNNDIVRKLSSWFSFDTFSFRGVLPYAASLALYSAFASTCSDTFKTVLDSEMGIEDGTITPEERKKNRHRLVVAALGAFAMVAGLQVCDELSTRLQLRGNETHIESFGEIRDLASEIYETEGLLGFGSTSFVGYLLIKANDFLAGGK